MYRMQASPSSRESLATVSFDTSTMRAIALTLTPSAKAETTADRFEALSTFAILDSSHKLERRSYLFAILPGFFDRLVSSCAISFR